MSKSIFFRIIKEHQALNEKFIDAREYAEHGLIHPQHVKDLSGRIGSDIDFYGSPYKFDGHADPTAKHHLVLNRITSTHAFFTHQYGEHIGKQFKLKIDSRLPTSESKQHTTKAMQDAFAEIEALAKKNKERKEKIKNDPDYFKKKIEASKTNKEETVSESGVKMIPAFAEVKHLARIKFADKKANEHNEHHLKYKTHYGTMAFWANAALDAHSDKKQQRKFAIDGISKVNIHNLPIRDKDLDDAFDHMRKERTNAILGKKISEVFQFFNKNRLDEVEMFKRAWDDTDDKKPFEPGAKHKMAYDYGRQKTKEILGDSAEKHPAGRKYISHYAHLALAADHALSNTKGENNIHKETVSMHKAFYGDSYEYSLPSYHEVKHAVDYVRRARTDNILGKQNVGEMFLFGKKNKGQMSPEETRYFHDGFKHGRTGLERRKNLTAPEKHKKAYDKGYDDGVADKNK